MQHQGLYDKYLQGRHWEDHPTLYAERFAEFLSECAFSGRVVDFGCGTGRDAAFLSERGFDVLGVDYAEEDIAKARELHPNVNFEVQNLESLRLGDQSVGAGFCINVMHYVDQVKALLEMRRSLRPGGYLFVHFNLRIVDAGGKVDYEQDEAEIMERLTDWRVVDRQVFERLDKKPVEHTHTILQLMLTA